MEFLKRSYYVRCENSDRWCARYGVLKWICARSCWGRNLKWGGLTPQASVCRPTRLLRLWIRMEYDVEHFSDPYILRFSLEGIYSFTP